MNAAPTDRPGSPGEVFRVFLKLGLTAFGGPIAHLGYFRDELVTRRRWVDEAAYADLVALCQFLPGPASSQVGYALGLVRGGALGGVLAWCAFTLPSAGLLVLLAALPVLDGPVGTGVLHGLKLVAVAVVAQAVWGMARTLAADRPRAAIALVALVSATASASLGGAALGQVAAIALGAAAGLVFCRGGVPAARAVLPVPVSRGVGLVALGSFLVLLLALPIVAASGGHGAEMFAAFYRSGALVFGGGHVVLPLLEAATVAPGWIGPDAFLAGYGATQAVPGPLFGFAAYLGAVMTDPPNGVAGAALGLVAIFLPGLLLVTGALPFWHALRDRPGIQAALRGANAAVVGLLGAALYDPVFTGAVLSRQDFAAALVGFVLLARFAVQPWIVVAMLAACGPFLSAP